jgi:hypothetical protein
MNQHYNQSYSRGQVRDILGTIKQCIHNGDYNIEANSRRLENVHFISTYNITTDAERRILLAIVVEDFCHSLANTKKGFEHEVLFVFAPKVQLDTVDGYAEEVCIYIKFNLIQKVSGNYAIVVSFHPTNRSIDYAFIS